MPGEPTPLFPDADARPRRKAKAGPRRLGRKATPALPRELWFSGPVLALDPSSTAVGWAFLDGGRLVRADVLKVPGGWETFRRVDRLSDLTREVVASCPPGARVLMEYTSGLHARSTAVGVSACAHTQGAIRARLRQDGVPVEMVPEQWAIGMGTKAKRVQAIRLAEPRLARIDDPGGDAADAAGLGLWWIQRNQG